MLGAIAVAIALVPTNLCWSLPHDIWRACRQGRTAEMRAHMRGLWDGLLDRPVPFERLGLR